jgi:hypothetical protein
MTAVVTYAAHAWDPVGRPEQTATLHEWCRLMDVQIAALSSLLQGGSAFVTDQASAPTTTFITPLVFDHTGSTGGLYAWTGAAYLKIGLATT